MGTPYLPESVVRLARSLRGALDGGPTVAHLPGTHSSGSTWTPGTALVVQTSGSTGTPRQVALTASALLASATGGHERLGGPGRWVLVLPTTHIAGVQVVVRSLVALDAGVPRPLVAAEPDAPFTPGGLARLLAGALDDGAPCYLSLVPTQLHRVIAAADEGEPAALDALARCAGVLLGGAATPPALLRRAVAAGVPVRRTYGMSETAGGCVYDGVPLAGARIRLAAGGRVEIAGPMLASGYVGDPEATSAAFHDEGGERWFRTSDLGSLDPGGTLTILGRGDDVIISGGVNVTPAVVETVLAEVLPAILQVPAVEVCVVGVPDAEWGQAVVAVVAAPDIGAGPPTPVDPVTLAAVRAAVAGRLEAPPRRVYLTGSLPVRGPGKVDRKAVAAAIP